MEGGSDRSRDSRGRHDGAVRICAARGIRADRPSKTNRHAAPVCRAAHVVDMLLFICIRAHGYAAWSFAHAKQSWWSWTFWQTFVGSFRGGCQCQWCQQCQ